MADCPSTIAAITLEATMLILHDPSDLHRITNPAVRQLVALRWQQLHFPDDLDSEPVEFIVIEAGDAVTEIDEAVGIPILTSLFDEIPYGHDSYVPPTEYIERHCHETGSTSFEMYVCLTDEGAGSVVFIADQEGTDTRLLSMLREFSTPAMSTP
jgi:hypothetical protein